MSKVVSPPPPYDKRFQQLLEKYPIVFFCECQRLSSKQVLLDRVLFVTAHGILMLFTKEGLGKRVEALFVPQNVNLLHVHTDERFFGSSDSQTKKSSKSHSSSSKTVSCKVLLRFKEGKDLMFQFDGSHRHATATNLFDWAGHQGTVGTSAQSILGGFLSTVHNFLPQKEQQRVLMSPSTVAMLDAVQATVQSSQANPALCEALVASLRRCGQDGRVRMSLAPPPKQEDSNEGNEEEQHKVNVKSEWSAAFGEECVSGENLKDDFVGHGPPPAPPPESVPPPIEHDAYDDRQHRYPATEEDHNDLSRGLPHLSSYGQHHSGGEWPAEFGGQQQVVEADGRGDSEQDFGNENSNSHMRRDDMYDDSMTMQPPAPRVVDHSAAIAAAELYLTSLNNYTLVQRLLRYSESLVDEAHREITEKSMLERRESMESRAQESEFALEELVSQICHRSTLLRQERDRHDWERRVESDLQAQRRMMSASRHLI